MSSKTVFQGRVVQVNLEIVRLPNGQEAELEIIRHPGGAAVLAVDDKHRVCLLHQFRHAAGGYIWELPAGKIDNREPPFQTAQRELQEEAGCTAERWESLGEVVSSPGVFAEVVHLFLAQGLKQAGATPDAHEVFTIEWRPFSEVVRMAGEGEIRDAKSVAAIFRALQRFPELAKG